MALAPLLGFNPRTNPLPARGERGPEAASFRAGGRGTARAPRVLLPASGEKVAAAG
ncbi:hypothetical protein GHK56_24535 [Sinorhizobium meliloti]|nr:hypothetical protein [Sinorhizobium meliloti]